MLQRFVYKLLQRFLFYFLFLDWSKCFLRVPINRLLRWVPLESLQELHSGIVSVIMSMFISGYKSKLSEDFLRKFLYIFWQSAIHVPELYQGFFHRCLWRNFNKDLRKISLAKIYSIQEVKLREFSLWFFRFIFGSGLRDIHR